MSVTALDAIPKADSRVRRDQTFDNVSVTETLRLIKGATSITSVNNQNLTIQATGGAATQRLSLLSSGTGADAIRLEANNGGIDIDAGDTGFAVDTTGVVSIDSSSTGASNVSTTGAGSTLTIEATGGGANQLVLNSAGTGADAVNITAASGGVTVSAGDAGLSVDSSSAGLRVPRVAGTGAVTSPTKGMVVYNTNDDVMYVYNGSSWAAFASGSGISGADNVIIRTDGTGGVTQASNLKIPDLHTAAPNDTNNVVSIEVEGGTTSVGIAIVPKGDGAFMLAVPDGTGAGGNARGVNAVDLQMNRGNNAANVAAGDYSFIVGLSNRCDAECGFAAGQTHSLTSPGTNSAPFALGGVVNVTGDDGSGGVGNSLTIKGNRGALGTGYAGTVDTGAHSAMCGGQQSLAYLPCQRAHACGLFATRGDAQYTRVVVSAITSNASPTSMTINDEDGPSNVVIPVDKTISYLINVMGVSTNAGNAANYTRRCVVQNDGGTTTLLNNQTIGTDYESNASTDVTIAVVDSGGDDYLDIQVTGLAADTWHWTATVEGTEVGI